MQFELAKVLKAIEFADFVFCNEHEAKEFGKQQGMTEIDFEQIATKIAKWKKNNTQRPRVAIITQGPLPVVVAINHPGQENVEVKQYPISELTKEEIVDTCGAGDAFVGGFLSQYYQDKPVDTCISAGIYLSREIVKGSGCTFPERMEWKESI